MKSRFDKKFIENTINNDLSKLAAWANQWLITFNVLKTKFLYISLKKSENQQPLKLILNQTQLEEVSEHKSLGLIINNKLTWSNHINNLCLSASKRIGIFKAVSSKIDYSTKLQIYKTFIRPCLEYGDVIFDSSECVHLQRLEKLQRQAALIITGAYKVTETNILLREVNLHPLQTRRKIHKLILFYKIINKYTPSYLQTLFPVRREQTSQLRSAGCFISYRCRIEKYSKTFSIYDKRV